MNKRIPIKVAKRIAAEYGYDQIVILACNTVDPAGSQWVLTYGRDDAANDAATIIGDTLHALARGQAHIVV